MSKDPELASRDETAAYRDDARLGDAIAFAVWAHRGQVYAGLGGHADEPYILHPLRVMMAVPEEARVIAVLHDCMEDYGRLPHWIGGWEEEAIRLLTRTAPWEYEPYIEAIATAPAQPGRLARIVKLADLRENLGRNPPERLRKRYEAAIERLVRVEAGTLHDTERQ